jgi:hypothetical protein
MPQQTGQAYCAASAHVTWPQAKHCDPTITMGAGCEIPDNKNGLPSSKEGKAGRFRH